MSSESTSGCHLMKSCFQLFLLFFDAIYQHQEVSDYNFIRQRSWHLWTLGSWWPQLNTSEVLLHLTVVWISLDILKWNSASVFCLDNTRGLCWNTSFIRAALKTSSASFCDLYYTLRIYILKGFLVTESFSCALRDLIFWRVDNSSKKLCLFLWWVCFAFQGSK